MSMKFNEFADVIAKRHREMARTGLFRTTVDKDLLWGTYLTSFPEGANPTYKTRTEHDCSACRHFVKTLGGVVTIVDGRMETLWDIEVGANYQPVVDALDALVRGAVLDNVFLCSERSVGTAKNFSLEDGTSVEWRHFFVNLPDANVAKKDSIGPTLGHHRATFDVMLRGLREIDSDAVDVVLDLIAQNSLYRGEEHAASLQAFRNLQIAFKAAPNEEMFCWTRIAEGGAAVGRIRNTAIGTLLVDLSSGLELEDAVKSFEAKVAPTNYKRPRALVTKAMIAKAQETVKELGFMSALERRYATIDDVTINNVLFANRAARREMNVFDELAAAEVVDPRKLERVEEVPVATFIERILPQAESIEALFENRHAGNLVSLIAPTDPTAKNMFKWPNNFSWSYAGELTDSIKERVKRAGGNVTGDFRASLSWHNYDDLDLHLVEPNGGHIFYANKRAPSGGWLDVDMNAGGGTTRTPVENISYQHARQMPRGRYKLYVNQFAPRESIDVGFEVEVEFLGTIYRFDYPKTMRIDEDVFVAEFRMTGGLSVDDGKLEMITSLPNQQVGRVLWSVQTQTFHSVKTVMLSPNHWDGHAQGNRHWFFMLEGCKNEERARGFFNEFLSEELTPHRKVLEIVGAKMKTDESDRQLSGLGFSSTQRNSLLVRVKGSFNRIVNVTF